MSHILKQKQLLKELKTNLKSNQDLDYNTILEICDTINMIIGRLNCELTDDDNKLNKLALIDKIRE